MHTLQFELLSLLQDFYKFLKDDGALLRAADARWLLVPSETNSLYHSQAVNRAQPPPAKEPDEPEGTTHLGHGTHIHGLRIALPEEAIEIDAADGLVIGRGVDCHVTLDSPAVSHFFIGPFLFLAPATPLNFGRHNHEITNPVLGSR